MEVARSCQLLGGCGAGGPAALHQPARPGRGRRWRGRDLWRLRPARTPNTWSGPRRSSLARLCLTQPMQAASCPPCRGSRARLTAHAAAAQYPGAPQVQAGVGARCRAGQAAPTCCQLQRGHSPPARGRQAASWAQPAGGWSGPPGCAGRQSRAPRAVYACWPARHSRVSAAGAGDCLDHAHGRLCHSWRLHGRAACTGGKAARQRRLAGGPLCARDQRAGPGRPAGRRCVAQAQAAQAAPRSVRTLMAASASRAVLPLDSLCVSPGAGSSS